MKKTITRNEFVDEMKAQEPSLSAAAMSALFDYLEERDRDCGMETEFDPQVIACDWNQYESAVEAAEDYGWVSDNRQEDETEDQFDERREQDALEWLQDHTQVVPFRRTAVLSDGRTVSISKGVVVGSF